MSWPCVGICHPLEVVGGLVFHQKRKGCNNMKSGNDDEYEADDDSDHQFSGKDNGNGRQCNKHIGLLKVGKDSHPLYVSGRWNGHGCIVVCDILWGMRPLDCLSQFLTARNKRGLEVELKVAATARDLGKEFSRISPESIRQELLDLSNNGHNSAVLPEELTVASSSSPSSLNAAYA